MQHDDIDPFPPGIRLAFRDAGFLL